MRERLPIRYSLYLVFWQGVDLFLPPDCGGCGKKGVRWCDACRQNLVNIVEPCCKVCCLPQPDSGVCERCVANDPLNITLRSWVVFDGVVRNTLHRVKYKCDFGIGEQLAAEMLLFIKGLGRNVELAVPVPLGGQRHRERGYNQVTSFRRPLALSMGWKFSPKELKRVKETRSQVDLSAIECVKNVKDAFVADRGRDNGKSVLVLADVSTTGATLNSCADVLIRGGAKEVFALTVAHALPQHGLRTI